MLSSYKPKSIKEYIIVSLSNELNPIILIPSTYALILVCGDHSIVNLFEHSSKYIYVLNISSKYSIYSNEAYEVSLMNNSTLEFIIVIFETSLPI